MSNVEGEHPDFDDLDLPADNVPPPDDEVAQPADDFGPVGEGADLESVESEEAEVEETPREEELEEEEKGPGLLARLATASPYVVLLGIALLAILISMFCLWMELRRYDYETRPTTQAARTPAAQSGPANTTAAA